MPGPLPADQALVSASREEGVPGAAAGLRARVLLTICWRGYPSFLACGFCRQGGEGLLARGAGLSWDAVTGGPSGPLGSSLVAGNKSRVPPTLGTDDEQ